MKIPPPVTVHPYNERDFLRHISGEPVAFKVGHVFEVRDAAHAVVQSGNKLAFIVLESVLPLDHIKFTADMDGIPLVVIPASFGKFRKIEGMIETMKKFDLTIFLPPDAAGMTGIRILSSVGIETTIMMGTKTGILASLIDLAAYALLGPAPHAPIEPFEYIAGTYEPSKPVNWEFLLLEKTSGPKIPDLFCRDCKFWNVCHSRLASSSDLCACTGFFGELIDLIETRRRVESCPGQKPRREATIRYDDSGLPRAENDNASAGPHVFERSVPWINASGTAADALLLSSVLKQVVDTYPKRRFHLVQRNHFGNILAGHPAILTVGNPPKDEPLDMIRLDFSNGLPGNETAYQALARKLAVQSPAKEKFFVPWEFEDDPLICKMARRGTRNVLVARNSGKKDSRQEKDWESLIHILTGQDISAVQAGSKDDPLIRGAYSVLGLLSLRQLISFPRHFDVVVTNQELMLNAARLCNVPCIDARTIPRTDDLIVKIMQLFA